MIASISFVLFFSQAAHSGSIWDNFLQHPSKEGVSELKAEIVSKPVGCSQRLMPTEKEMHQLFGLVQDANDSAFRAALLVSKCFGIGDLEDLYRASGIFLEKNPAAFLKIVNESDIPDRDLRYMVIMLPLTLTDKLDSKISAVNRRIAAIEAVQEASLFEMRNKILLFLRVEMINLQEINARKAHL